MPTLTAHIRAMLRAVLAGGALLPAAAMPAAAQGVVQAPAVPQPRQPGELVGLLLQNPFRARLPAGPVTFGQVFIPGQVPAGAGLIARLGTATGPAQLDVKATNPDGSVRMGVVTLMAPALAEGATQPVLLLRAPAPAAGPPVDLARSQTALTVTLTPAGAAPRTLDVDALLAAALADGHASTWLQGKLTTEARVDVPVGGSLHVVLDVRCAADGAQSTDIQFDNDLALQRDGGEADYAVTIARAGTALFARPALHQFQYTTWHREIADRMPPLVVHDVAYLERSGAILDYDLAAGVAGSALAAEARAMARGGPAFDVLGNADLTLYMGTTGGRADIGPTTEANAVWLVSQQPTARAYALAQADAAGSVPWHMFEAATGMHLTTLGHPTFWNDDRGGADRSSTGLTQKVHPWSRDCGCWAPEAAHQPDLSYVPYLLTASRYRLDELVAQAAWGVTGTWPTLREDGRGIVVSSGLQVRRVAWNLRGIDNAAYVLPDAHPLKAYFTRLRADNYAVLLRETTRLTALQGAPHGWLPGVNREPTHVPPWQQDYLGLVVAQAARQGVAEARQFLAWESNFLVGRFLAADLGFSPYDGVAYQLVMAPDGTRLGEQPGVLTWAEVAQLTRAAGLSGCAGGGLFGCGWAKAAFPQYRQQALGVVAEIGHVLPSPQATQAYAWLADHVALGRFGIASAVRFNIAPPP